MLGKQYEGFQDGERSALEYRRAGDLQIAVTYLESAVERHSRPRFAFPQDDFSEMLADEVAEFGNAHDHPVVFLHEAFDGQFGVVVFVAQHCSQTSLMVEQQAVLSATGEHMQAIAHLPDELLRSCQQAVFPFGEETLIDHRLQVQRAELPPCNPQNGLDVAQSPRRALHVRLQVVLGVVVLGVPSALFVALSQEKLFARPHFLRAGDPQHGLA